MATPKGGYTGKILDVNLTTGAIKTIVTEEALARRYLGGTGLATYYMYREIPKGADPLGPQNLLIFASGPLNGTQFPGSRTSVNFKSPINGHFGNSFVGGGFASELKWAGWDMVIFRGAAPKPVYLDIQNDKVTLHDAAAHWGKDTYATEYDIKKELADREGTLTAHYAHALVIGPAGENKSRVACIISERFRAAGRNGGGAVMGSKNLKAVIVRGTKAVPVASKEKFNPIANEALQLAAINDRRPGFRMFGTAHSMDENTFVVGSAVTRNFQTTWFPAQEHLGGAAAQSQFWQRHASCIGCPIHCMKFGIIRNSELFRGLVAEGPEYESGVMQGCYIGVDQFDGMMWLIEKCDALGLDNIGSGNVVGFTMELYEKGILKAEDLDGIKAEWGNVEAAGKLFDACASGKGKAGALLSLGVGDMAKKLGGEALKYAIKTKNQGLAAHDPRGNRSMMFSYAIGPRGGVHTDGNSIQGMVDRCIHSLVCMCYFVPAAWRARQVSILIDVLNPLCDWNMNMDELQTIGRRVLTLQRAYSHREGKVSRKDDTLSDRLFNEPLTEGPAAGRVVTREEVKKMQDEYYALLGWDDNGIPTDATLKKYGLDFAIADMRS